MIDYSTRRAITADQFVDILHRSTLAERRPVDDADCIDRMLQNADLLVTAWDNGRLVGVARSVTDFAYCCYLSDLAVDAKLQRSGVGRGLLRITKSRLGPKCMLILLSAPAAKEYYAKVGLERHDGAWVLPGEKDVV